MVWCVYGDDAPARRVTAAPAVVEAVCGAVREAITNVGKHSGVDSAVVRAMVNRDGRLTVSVVDHGRGFDPAAGETGAGGAGTGAGLAQSVRARMAQIGGTTRIHSEPGNGTEIELSVMLVPRQEAGRQPTSEAAAVDAERRARDERPVG